MGGSAVTRRNKCLSLRWEESYCLWQDKFSEAQRGAAAATESSCLTSARVNVVFFFVVFFSLPAPPQKAKCASWERSGHDMTGGPQGGLLSHLALQDATNKSSEFPADDGQRSSRCWVAAVMFETEFTFLLPLSFWISHTRGGERKLKRLATVILKKTADWFEFIKERRKKQMAVWRGLRWRRRRHGSFRTENKNTSFMFCFSNQPHHCFCALANKSFQTTVWALVVLLRVVLLVMVVNCR